MIRRVLPLFLSALLAAPSSLYPSPVQSQSQVWEVTAYACPPHCGLTASGVQVGPGSIAAPWWVPFGTVLYVDGYGYGTVVDRGGAIYGNRLDVFMPSRAAAFQWGRRWVSVEWGAEPESEVVE